MRRLGLLVVTLSVVVGCGSDSADTAKPQRDFPQVTSQDGALLSPMRLVTLVAQNESDASTLFEFSKVAGRSYWWQRLAGEYGLSTLTAVASLTGPAISADMTDHDVFEYITTAVATNGGPQFDGNTLYLLYLPDGINVIQRGATNTDCSYFAAYHAPYGPLGDNLAVVQRCPKQDEPASITISASHEIIEAATDPDDDSYALPVIAQREPWHESIWNAYLLEGHAELADLCEATYYQEAGFFYQRVWSNSAASDGGDPCIPELADPFYDVAFGQEWYPINAGATLQIPVTGWATGSVAPWGLYAYAATNGDAFDVSFQSQTLSDGQSTNLTVTAPSGAASGTLAWILAWSTRPHGTRMSDGGHAMPVGVYVP